MKKAALLLALMVTVLPATPVAAQTSPYASEPERAIKALSDEETAGLLDGAGLGFARAAELNGLPGPRHALDLADDLHLTDAQRALLEDVFIRMRTAARRLGTAIVRGEQELDALFAAGTADTDEIRRRSIELGRLYGELRAVHLAAHVEAAAILGDHQIAAYARLRGYAGDEPGGDAGHGAHH